MRDYWKIKYNRITNIKIRSLFMQQVGKTPAGILTSRFITQKRPLTTLQVHKSYNGTVRLTIPLENQMGTMASFYYLGTWHSMIKSFKVKENINSVVLLLTNAGSS